MPKKYWNSGLRLGHHSLATVKSGGESTKENSIAFGKAP